MNKKEFVCQAIEEKQQFFNAVSDEVWSYAEAGMKEYQSAECLEKAARELGFSVETGLSGIPTAFVASWGSGKPVIAYLGEYDALPGLSQKAACPVKDELSPGAYGHGCGHNCLGTAALAAAWAAKEFMEKNHLSGTVRYYGCPGEEYGSAKAFMACLTMWTPASPGIPAPPTMCGCAAAWPTSASFSASRAALPTPPPPPSWAVPLWTPAS